MSDSSRIDALETAVARLTRDLVAMRHELQQRRGAEGGAHATTAGVDAPDAPDAPDATNASVAGEMGNTSLPPVPATPQLPGSGAEQGDIYVSEEMRRIAAGVSATAPRPSRWRAGAGRDAGGAGTAGEASPGAGRSPSFASTIRREGIETLVGRYGTLALAAFTILMGVGAFVGWAIRNGVIGPELRVALGLVASAAVAVTGVRLRRGDSPRFGGVLLALSLAMLHVVCWAAGPLLHLVPDAVALSVASAASAALATLALREADQSLFNVGFGGALLAPFVTASDAGDPRFLLLYGALVLVAGMRVGAARAWGKTPFVLGAGVAGYTAAATGQVSARDPAWLEAASAVFALAMSWLSLLLLRGRAGPHLASVALVASLSALGVVAPLGDGFVPGAALALAVTITGYVAIAEQEGANRWTALLNALLLPLAACLVALDGVPSQAHARQGGIVAAWFAVSAAAAVINRDNARSWHAFTAVVFGGFPILAWLDDDPRVRLLALAAYCAAAAYVMRRQQLRSIALPIFGWLVVATVAAWAMLDARGTWIPRPFVTPASGVTAVVCTAWLIFSWHWARTEGERGDGLDGARRTVARLLGSAVTFAWIHTELAHTISIDVSTFLLVAYYAVTGVLAIGVGRMRGIAALRQVGLALSVLAAVRALVETTSMSIGWKVGGYLLAGAFLLGVAYWYRSTGDTPSPASSGRTTA